MWLPAAVWVEVGMAEVVGNTAEVAAVAAAAAATVATGVLNPLPLRAS